MKMVVKIDKNRMKLWSRIFWT